MKLKVKMTPKTPLDLIGVTGETAFRNLDRKFQRSGLFCFSSFSSWPESRATRHVSLPGPLIALSTHRALRERAEGPARRARDSPDRKKLRLSRIARERRSKRASSRRRRSVGGQRAARVRPDGSCRFSSLCRSLSVSAGAYGGNGRGDGDPRDGARAPGVAIYERLARRARGPHPQGAAHLRTRVLSQRPSTRPTFPSGRVDGR